MKPLYTANIFNSSKTEDKLPCQCYNCNKEFYIMKKLILHELKYNRGRIKFCSKFCYDSFQTQNNLTKCANCDKEITKKLSQINKSKSGNNFCSRSCSVSYNNKHKTTGTRRSKLESWLEEQLTNLYPDLKFHFNRKDTIGSELDIYIPSLYLAFELNGIFHYEPIYGENKLQQIQENDNNKFQACQKHGISLCTIDTSSLKYFKEKNILKYLNIITNIINKSKNSLNS